MGWTSIDEEVNKKKGMKTSSKLLLGIIFCIVFIILIIFVLFNIRMNSVILSVDGKEKMDYDMNKLVSNIDNITYINIEEFAKLVGYEYHKGEYKSFSNEEDKCYVIGKDETATFYLNENKINKMPVDSNLNEEYREHLVKYPAKIINNKMYGTKESIGIAFNSSVSVSEKSVIIITLNHLVKIDNANAIKLGYTDITDQTFENKKALLYDRLIVKKKEGMYKIVNRQNTQEIVPDKYTDIQFSESEQQFFVTNSLGKVGVLDINGNVKIEPIYDSISILDEEQKLYIVEKEAKFGILKNGDTEIITPKYDAIGCDLTTIKINETEKTVNPVVTIEECEGIVVKKDGKYGVIDIEENIIVPIQVDSIYSLKNDENELEYFMLYNGEELNIIKMLIEQGIIKPKEEETVQEDKNNTNTITNTIENINNTVTTDSGNKITNTTVKNIV